MLSFFTPWAQGFVCLAVTVGIRQYTLFVNYIQLQYVLTLSSTSKSLTVYSTHHYKLQCNLLGQLLVCQKSI